MVFKQDQMLIKLTSVETDVSAIRGMLAELQSNKIQLRTHDTALFGADFQGGVLADVRQLKDDKAFRTKVWIGLIGFITANFGLLWAWIANVKK